MVDMGKRKVNKTNFEKTRDIKKRKRSSGQSELYKFKLYKIIESGKRHPKLIVGNEIKDEEEFYKFMGLTSKAKKGKNATRKNIELDKNPKQGASGKSYLRREIQTDYKSNFFKGTLSNYSLSKTDKKKVQDYLNKQKKK